MPRKRTLKPIIIRPIENSRASVEAVKAANAAIKQGSCPACGGTLTFADSVIGQSSGEVCNGCSFKITVAPPLNIDTRAAFHRRWTTKVGGMKGYAPPSVW